MSLQPKKRINLRRNIRFTKDDSSTLDIKAGIQIVDGDVADHWFVRAHRDPLPSGMLEEVDEASGPAPDDAATQSASGASGAEAGIQPTTGAKGEAVGAGSATLGADDLAAGAVGAGGAVEAEDAATDAKPKKK